MGGGGSHSPKGGVAREDRLETEVQDVSVYVY
jgi:hypothetical protein